ncbi:hypothetical protein EON66_07690 [archaeon]|nr:MAG: hypothetical protein EON66_07690 [archaeon]
MTWCTACARPWWRYSRRALPTLASSTALAARSHSTCSPRYALVPPTCVLRVVALSVSRGITWRATAWLQGWDKTYCLKYLLADGFTDIHFYGDKTMEGGNDHEIFVSPLTHGHTTTGPADTMAQCRALFLS